MKSLSEAGFVFHRAAAISFLSGVKGFAVTPRPPRPAALHLAAWWTA